MKKRRRIRGTENWNPDFFSGFQFFASRILLLISTLPYIDNPYSNYYFYYRLQIVSLVNVSARDNTT